MKAIIAMDSFKECMTAIEACQAVASGIKRVFPDCECVLMPVSDGGEGLLHAFNCEIERLEVTGPLHGMKVMAEIGYLDNRETAIIESAQANGLALIPTSMRDPSKTTTHGVGEMLMHAIKQGCRRVIIGLGGSATNDLGTGMLNAMGVEFRDKNGVAMVPCGGNLNEVSSIANIEAIAKMCENTEIILASDVNNPLYGPNGAAHVYAKQKGASPEMIETLDENARAFSLIVAQALGRDLSSTPGAGAAGGLGYALLSFFNCQFNSGASLVLDTLEFDHHVADAHLTITGEGRSDAQTLMGKIPSLIMERAKAKGVKTALLSGKVDNSDTLVDAGFHATESITPHDMPLEIALQTEVAMRNLEEATVRVVSQIASSLQA